MLRYSHLNMPWDQIFNADQVLLAFWRSQGYTTEDPCKAQLFFVPVLSSLYGQVRLRSPAVTYLRACSAHAWLLQAVWFGSNLSAQGEASPDYAVELLLPSRQAYLMNSALATVRQGFPYFNRTKGLDHFWIPTTDWGRCGGAPSYETSESMFALSYFGELDFRFLSHGRTVLPDPSPPFDRVLNTSRGVLGARTRSEPCSQARC